MISLPHHWDRLFGSGHAGVHQIHQPELGRPSVMVIGKSGPVPIWKTKHGNSSRKEIL